MLTPVGRILGPPKTTMATLIAYLRLPGNGPRKRHDQAGYRRDAVLAWARRRRHQVAAFVEEDEPAALKGRQGLAAAVAGLSDDGIDGLVVTSLTSLSEDLVAQEQLLAEILRTGAKVYSLDPDDAEHLRSESADPSRNLVRQVLQKAVENEATIIAIRSAARATNGGSPPYGYRVEDGQLVANPAEQAVLVRIAELRAQGSTFRQIARALDAEGHRPKRARRWHPETVRRVVQRTQL
jgi:DNA invertase Pin-like site-specific DNA recombinase